eukprot:TRINITY_DN405_c6_g1_i1.p1 TRINITY_DN405_c6_g1~~TRINITY_DN405_c6_g1_i1.p1  ORF type:complete len:215 (+),score=44.95 TRINITY_DN405_c6_g1_i1:52-696(+)
MNDQDMASLMELCDPEGTAQRKWESDRAQGKRVTGYSASTAGQQPAAVKTGADTPGNLGPQISAATAAAGVNFSKEKPRKKIPIDEKDIWDADEIVDLAVLEKRERPEHEILFKQQVGSNDVFLGLDYEKDPSSSSCEEMVIRIELPKENLAKDIKLDVEANSIDLRSPNYRLILPLQRTVLTNRGSAKWESDKKRMIVTLVIDKSAQGITKLL